LVSALCTPAAQATAIAVANHSFESQVLADGINVVGIAGWSSGGGVFNPLVGPTGSFSNPVPDGNNTAWLNGGSVSQVLNAFLLANSTYTLQVEVGDRRDSTFPGYSVSLTAGGHVLATESALTPNDGFLTSVISFTTQATNPYLGQLLGITLHSNGIQTNFDNVRLDVSTVPEPASTAMMLAGLAWLGMAARRRRG
jgi:hypothetical protein